MPLPRSLTSAHHGDIDLRLTSGTWPADLRGEMFISAPTPAPDLPYALFGLGVVIRLSLRPGANGAAADRWAWRTRTIDTPTQRLHAKDPEAFVPTPLGYSSAYGSPNMGNTAVLPWGDRLFATWDVGRPIEVDAASLGFLGEVGSKGSWGDPFLPSSDLLPFFFSTAHPIVDPDRDCLWTVKLLPVGFDPIELQPWVVRYEGDGTEVKAWPVQGATVRGSMHTITQTRDWLVLSDSGNFKADPGEMATGVRSVTVDDEVNLYLIRKDRIESTPVGQELTPHPFVLAPTCGHYYGTYDDSDGKVRVLFEHMDRLDLGFNLRADDRDAFDRSIDPAFVGLYNFGMAPHSISEVTFDPAAGTSTVERIVTSEHSWNQQLSAMDWSTEGISDPTSHHVCFHGFRPDLVSQRALAAYGDRVDRSRFPAEETAGSLVTFERGSLETTGRYEMPSLGDMPSSPIFVPRDSGVGAADGMSRYAGTAPGGHDGYVVLPVLSDDGLRIEVFDAAAVGAGPIATLAGERREQVPLLLHSCWMPEANTAPSVERLRFADELDEASLAGLDADRLRTVHEVAAELDDALAR